MIPCAVVLSIIYTVVKLGFADPLSFNFAKRKNFFMFIMDCLVGTWIGKTDYTGPTWTLNIELWNSIFVYILAFTVVQFSSRFKLYGLVMAFLYLPVITDSYFHTNVMSGGGAGLLFDMAPYFVIGTMLADMEVSSKKYRALDKLRNLSPRMTIVKNTTLALIFLFYGSVRGSMDRWEYDVDYTWVWLVSFGNKLKFK